MIESLVFAAALLPGGLLGVGAGVLLRRLGWRLIAGAAAVFAVAMLGYFVLPPPEPCETCAGEEGIYGPYDAIWILFTANAAAFLVASALTLIARPRHVGAAAYQSRDTPERLAIGEAIPSAARTDGR